MVRTRSNLQAGWILVLEPSQSRPWGPACSMVPRTVSGTASVGAEIPRVLSKRSLRHEWPELRVSEARLRGLIRVGAAILRPHSVRRRGEWFVERGDAFGRERRR